MIPLRKRHSPPWPPHLRRLLLINIVACVGSVAVIAGVAVAARRLETAGAIIWAAVGCAAVACAGLVAAAADMHRRQIAEMHARFAHLFHPLPRAIKGLTPIEQLAQAFDAHHAAARADKALLHTVIASMSDGVIATDHQQRVLLTNAAAHELLGLSAEGRDGPMLWEILPNQRVLDAVTEASLTGHRRTIELGPLHERHLAVTVWRLPLRPAGFVIMARDVTEATRYDELRKEFVANVSHELRTPLTMIKGFVETLLSGALNDPPRAAQYLATVQKHSDQLERLVVNLLNLSRLDSPSAAPPMQPLRLDEVAMRVVEQLSPAADRKGQVLALRTVRPCVTVTGDEAQLEQALINLVDNAIKYAGTGGRIEVAIADDETHAIVEVKDDGPGISPADLPRIFERFYRVDRSRSREMGGTGLGLSIVKHVAQAHGGSVEAGSTWGKGSTFTLRLPRSHARD